MTHLLTYTLFQFIGKKKSGREGGDKGKGKICRGSQGRQQSKRTGRQGGRRGHTGRNRGCNNDVNSHVIGILSAENSYNTPCQSIRVYS